LPESKVGLVALKGQPLAEDERDQYITEVSKVVPVEWQNELMIKEREDEKKWVNSISEHMKNGSDDSVETSLGYFVADLGTGARTWTSSAETVPELLAQIKKYYEGNPTIIYVWNTACNSCVEELTLSGLTYDKFKEEPLELLTLALDRNSSRQEWQRKIVDSYAQGDHIYVSKKLTAEIYEYFQLPPFPCYLYFDESGNFLPNKIRSIKDVDVSEVLSDG